MRGRHLEFDVRVSLVEEYLFSNNSAENISSRYGLASAGSLIKAYKDETVLRTVAEKRGLALEQVQDIRNTKLMLHIGKGPRVTKEQYDRAVKLFETTGYPLNLIGEQIGVSGTVVKHIQDDAIEKGSLDPEYRRLDKRKGLTQQRVDEIIRLLRETAYSLREVEKEVDISAGTVAKIQNQAIENGILDPKYRRLLGDVIQWQYDRSLELLKTTRLTLHEIGIEVRLNAGAIREVQNRAIEDGKLDPVYRRLVTGTLQLTYDRTIELLKETDWTLTKIGEEVGLDSSTMTRLQNRAIEVGRLDSSRRRPFNPIKNAEDLQQLLERTEDARTIVSMLTYGEDYGRAVARVLTLMYPNLVTEEDIPEYLPSLGPYLGKFLRIPRTPWDIIRPVPMALINRDEFVRDTFLDLGRAYVLGLLSGKPNEGDKTAALEIIDTESKNELNPESVRWLYSQLFDEFNEFFELSRRVNGSKVGA